MGHIFISYSHKDSLYVHKLADALEKEGFEVWIDDRIHYGSEWPKVVTRNLDVSDGIIVVLSNNSYESDMVQNEVARAREKKKPIFPLLLDGDNWLIVQAKQFVDIRDGSLPSEKFYKRLEEITPRKNKKEKREAAEKVLLEAEEKVIQKAAKDAAEKAERQAARRDAIKNLLLKLVPFLRFLGILGIIITLFWIGSWAIPKFVALTPTAKASVIPPANTEIAVTKTPMPPTQTIRPNATSTKVLTATSISLLTEITDAKGVQMALVPAGEFTMGSNIGEQDERPAHQVYLDAYYIDIYEVTNALYEACVTAGGCTIDTVSSTGYGNSEFDNYPVEVNWNQSNIYCKWRGANLPTEAQWEKAARGTDGRTYPWGNDLDAYRANYYNNTGGTTAVGSYESGKSPYGVYDLAGNVQEWVADWYGWSYYTSSPYANPLGPSSGYSHEPRGGTWLDRSSHIRSAARTPYFVSRPNEDSRWAGFRCAKDAP